MNPSSSSTSTPSASPPASVAEKPPRPPSSPKPPAWASASPSLGETASATTFSSTPDTAISGAFRSTRCSDLDTPPTRYDLLRALQVSICNYNRQGIEDSVVRPSLICEPSQRVTIALDLVTL